MRSNQSSHYFNEVIPTALVIDGQTKRTKSRTETPNREMQNACGERCSHGTSLTHRAVDACVLVVTEEEALLTATLVAAHGVDACVLAATVVELAFIHICREAWVSATAASVYKSLTQSEPQSQTVRVESQHFKIRLLA